MLFSVKQQTGKEWTRGWYHVRCVNVMEFGAEYLYKNSPQNNWLITHICVPIEEYIIDTRINY